MSGGYGVTYACVQCFFAMFILTRIMLDTNMQE